MSDIELNLVVLRTPRLEYVQVFYEALGINFVHERHGDGPAHLSTTFGSGVVLELYPSTAEEALSAGTMADVRIGLTVADLAVALNAATSAGGSLVSQRSDNHAVVADPDGRKVELSTCRPTGDVVAVRNAYWNHYADPSQDVWALELVDAVGRGAANAADIDPLDLFTALADGAAHDDALAYLGAGPLEDYLASDRLDVSRLARAVHASDPLARAFSFAYLPTTRVPDEVEQLRAVLSRAPGSHAGTTPRRTKRHDRRATVRDRPEDSS